MGRRVGQRVAGPVAVISTVGRTRTTLLLLALVSLLAACGRGSSGGVAAGDSSVDTGDTTTQLDDVRAALTGAGYEDTTQVEGHVTVTRDDTKVDVQPTPARGKGAWTVTVRSECADYDGDDLERVENDEGGPLDGV